MFFFVPPVLFSPLNFAEHSANVPQLTCGITEIVVPFYRFMLPQFLFLGRRVEQEQMLSPAQTWVNAGSVSVKCVFSGPTQQASG